MSEVFEPELNYSETILFITLNRIYDAQMALLASVNPEKAKQLAQLHEQGLTLAPAPAYRASEDDLGTQ